VRFWAFARAHSKPPVSRSVIYFIDGSLYPAKNAPPFDRFLYSMWDGSNGTMAPFAVEISEGSLRAHDGCLMNPTWLFPAE
jgi:hypothetical protein